MGACSTGEAELGETIASSLSGFAILNPPNAELRDKSPLILGDRRSGTAAA